MCVTEPADEQKCVSRLRVRVRVKVRTSTSTSTSTLSEECILPREQDSSVGGVAQWNNCLGVVHMEEGVQVRVQVEVGREEVGEGRDTQRRTKRGSNEERTLNRSPWMASSLRELLTWDPYQSSTRATPFTYIHLRSVPAATCKYHPRGNTC